MSPNARTWCTRTCDSWSVPERIRGSSGTQISRSFGEDLLPQDVRIAAVALGEQASFTHRLVKHGGELFIARLNEEISIARKFDGSAGLTEFRATGQERT